MLFRKMLRDMGRHKTQFVSIFIMAFLAVYIYCGVGGEWRGIKESVNEFYEETNIADVFLYGNGFSDGDSKAVKNIESVTNVERRLEVDTIADMDGDPEITLNFIEKNKISSAYLVEGEKFDIDDANGIWIDKRFADARDIKIGDTVTTTYNNIEIEKEVRGVIYSPEFVYLTSDSLTPNFYENGFAYLSYKAFPYPDMMIYNTMLINTTDDNMNALEDEISDVLDEGYSVFLSQDNHPSVNSIAEEIDQHKMFGDIFPVVFFIIALLIIMTTMTRIVTTQRTQIGTLKALGFKKRTIILHYVYYGSFLSFAGVVLGIIIGPLTLPYVFLPSMSRYYTLPEWKIAYNISYIIVAAAMVILCTLVTYFTCYKLLRDTPAKTLRPKSPKISKHSFLEKTRLWKHFGFNAQWNLRDILRNKIRALMAVLGVLGCTALVICAFGMLDAMNDLKEWQYEDLYIFDSKLIIDDTATENQIASAKEEVDGEFIMESAVEMRANDTKKTGVLTVAEDDTELLRFTNPDRKYISLPIDGIMMTAKMAASLGISEGDEIEWHIYGSEEWYEGTVTTIDRQPAGQGLTLSRSCFEDLELEFSPTSILTPSNVSEKPDGISSILSNSQLVGNWDEMAESMMIMVYILILAAAILSIVVLYNLGLLSFTEMERDMATLKVVGLKSRKLRSLLLTQNIWCSVIGFIIGVPSGMLLLKVICDSSGESFDYSLSLHPLNLIYSFLITFGFSILVNLMFSRKIRRLNMVESLKAVE